MPAELTPAAVPSARKRSITFGSQLPPAEYGVTDPNHSPAKTYDSYTWPSSVAPSTNVTPMPLTYHAGWVRLPKVKKAVPVSDRVLRSHVAKKKFRGLTVTPLNGLDFGP